MTWSSSPCPHCCSLCSHPPHYVLILLTVLSSSSLCSYPPHCVLILLTVLSPSALCSQPVYCDHTVSWCAAPPQHMLCSSLLCSQHPPPHLLLTVLSFSLSCSHMLTTPSASQCSPPAPHHVRALLIGPLVYPRPTTRYTSPHHALLLLLCSHFPDQSRDPFLRSCG